MVTEDLSTCRSGQVTVAGNDTATESTSPPCWITLSSAPIWVEEALKVKKIMVNYQLINVWNWIYTSVNEEKGQECRPKKLHWSMIWFFCSHIQGLSYRSEWNYMWSWVGTGIQRGRTWSINARQDMVAWATSQSRLTRRHSTWILTGLILPYILDKVLDTAKNKHMLIKSNKIISRIFSKYWCSILHYRLAVGQETVDQAWGEVPLAHVQMDLEHRYRHHGKQSQMPPSVSLVQRMRDLSHHQSAPRPAMNPVDINFNTSEI